MQKAAADAAAAAAEAAEEAAAEAAAELAEQTAVMLSICKKLCLMTAAKVAPQRRLLAKACSELHIDLPSDLETEDVYLLRRVLYAEYRKTHNKVYDSRVETEDILVLVVRRHCSTLRLDTRGSSGQLISRFLKYAHWVDNYSHAELKKECSKRGLPIWRSMQFLAVELTLYDERSLLTAKKLKKGDYFGELDGATPERRELLIKRRRVQAELAAKQEELDALDLQLQSLGSWKDLPPDAVYTILRHLDLTEERNLAGSGRAFWILVRGMPSDASSTLGMQTVMIGLRHQKSSTKIAGTTSVCVLNDATGKWEQSAKKDGKKAMKNSRLPSLSATRLLGVFVLRRRLYAITRLQINGREDAYINIFDAPVNKWSTKNIKQIKIAGDDFELELLEDVAVCANDTGIYFVGGLANPHSSDRRVEKLSFMYSIRDTCFHKLPDTPVAVYGAKACYIKNSCLGLNRIVVIGGFTCLPADILRNDDNVCTVVRVFQIDSNTWSCLDTGKFAAHPCSNPALYHVKNSDELFVYGGYDNDMVASSLLSCFDLKTKAWSRISLGTNQMRRANACMCALDERRRPDLISIVGGSARNSDWLPQGSDIEPNGPREIFEFNKVGLPQRGVKWTGFIERNGELVRTQDVNSNPTVSVSDACVVDWRC